MEHLLMMSRVVLGGLFALAVAPPAQAPSAILLEQRQREVVMVRHLREHVSDPGDGLALAADRRDLQRLRSGVPAAPAIPLPTTASDDELVDAIGALVDVWYARLVERQPFGMMPRERSAALRRVQQAIGQLQGRGRKGLDVWLAEVLIELNALIQGFSGQGELPDASIDVALRLADAAAAGRPMLTPGPYQPIPGGPGAPPPGPGAGPVPGGYPPSTPGAYPAPPLPPAGGPAPYALPPAYEAYSGQATGAVGYAACQTLRTSAGVSQSVADMVRAAECWTRTPTWPGWGEQALESLDWAVSLSIAERNCEALRTSIDALRELSPRVAALGLNAQTALAGRAERERRRLQGQSLCR
jgi:hypothetical protein